MILGDAEQEIFRKYNRALYVVGVDFSDERVDAAFEDCAFNLEPKIQAFLAWHEFMHRKGTRMHDPTELFLRAFKEEWTPWWWKDQYITDICEREFANN